MKQYLWILLLVGSLFSCTATSSLSKNNSTTQAITAAFNVHLYMDNKLDEKAGGSLRMLRDSVVQISLSKFGIEGLRLVFTPDSLLLLDKLKKRYYHNTYDGVKALFPGAQELNFERIQAFFWNDAQQEHEVGNTRLLGFVPMQIQVEREGKKQLLGHHFAEKLRLGIDIYNVKTSVHFKFSKIKQNADWEVLKRIPASYTEIKNEALLKMLFLLSEKQKELLTQ